MYVNIKECVLYVCYVLCIIKVMYILIKLRSCTYYSLESDNSFEGGLVGGIVGVIVGSIIQAVALIIIHFLRKRYFPDEHYFPDDKKFEGMLVIIHNYVVNQFF